MPAPKPVNNTLREVVTQASGHMAIATEPDVCLVPPKKEPQPFNNWVESKQIKKLSTSTVTFMNAPICVMSTEWGPPSEPAHAGKLGGRTSGAYRGHAVAISSSADLRAEGTPAVRKDDLTSHNHKGSVANTTGIVVNTEELFALLRDKFGRIPERYCPMLAGGKAASKRLVDALPKVQAHLNEVGQKAAVPVTVSQAELATNFLAEGGNQAVQGDSPDAVSGYGHMGIDAMLKPTPDAKGNYQLNSLYRGWIHSSVASSYADPANVAVNTNDAMSKPATVAAPAVMTIEQGLYANGGMYAASKARAAADIQKTGTDFASLPASAQFYWATVYYNAGWGGGATLLEKKGVDWYKTPWTKEEGWWSKMAALDKEKRKFDYPYESAHYNALKRLASFELLVGSCGAALD